MITDERRGGRTIWQLSNVLDFAYEYLARHALPPTDEEVRNVTLVLAQCAGRVVARATADSLVRDARTPNGAPADP